MRERVLASWLPCFEQRVFIIAPKPPERSALRLDEALVVSQLLIRLLQIFILPLQKYVLRC